MLICESHDEICSFMRSIELIVRYASPRDSWWVIVNRSRSDISISLRHFTMSEKILCILMIGIFMVARASNPSKPFFSNSSRLICSSKCRVWATSFSESYFHFTDSSMMALNRMRRFWSSSRTALWSSARLEFSFTRVSCSRRMCSTDSSWPLLWSSR